MIAFDLRCSLGHVFEGWFRSSADYDDQAARGLIPCAICGDVAVAKAVMAPNIGMKSNQRPDRPVAQQASVEAGGVAAAPPGGGSAPPVLANAPQLPAEVMAVLGEIARAQAEALPQSRWVGDRFAKEARELHAAAEDNGTPPAPIHGEATRDEAEALIEDGIAVMPLLVPFVPPSAKN